VVGSRVGAAGGGVGVKGGLGGVGGGAAVKQPVVLTIDSDEELGADMERLDQGGW
jgi:hypothetical protein